MKKLLFVVTLFLAPLFIMAQVADTTTLKKTGDIAPGFEFNIAKDKTAKLSDYHGKVVLLNFLPPGAHPAVKSCQGYKKRSGKNIRITLNSRYLL